MKVFYKLGHRQWSYMNTGTTFLSRILTNRFSNVLRSSKTSTVCFKNINAGNLLTWSIYQQIKGKKINISIKTLD